MRTEETNNPSVRGDLRIELIDSWHAAWPTVLNDIERQGKRAVLRIDHDGWLSARQCVLVAFDGASTSPAGHLVFSIEPSATERPSENASERRVDARLDDVGDRPGFDAGEVRALLVDCAKRYARSLRCQQLIGFDGV